MKAVGIIVEYNPFHNGHKYHYQNAKKYGDIVVAVMSGDFLQRGEPAIIDRWKRAEIALKNGIDLVVELPVFYSSQSAEVFAIGAVGILKLLEVETLVFGSETADIEKLRKRAELIEKEEFKNQLKTQLKSGISYPNAYSNCLRDFGMDGNIHSNDILGVEYLKALKYWNTKIKPVVIKREGGGYYSFDENNGVTSATRIRNKIFSNETITKFIPSPTYKILSELIKNMKICKLDDFYPLIRYKILSNYEELKDIQDIEEGYSKKLYEVAQKEESFENFFERIKSKRYTIGRIQRVLIHILLGITKEMTENVKKNIPYVHILGFNKNGQKYLRKISDNHRILSSLKNVKKRLNDNELYLLEKNENAGKIYSMINRYEERRAPVIFDDDK